MNIATLTLLTLVSVPAFAATKRTPPVGCEILFNGDTEAKLGETEIPLPDLAHAVAKFVPQFAGDPSGYLSWTFLPRGRGMVVQVHTLEAKTRFLDVGVLRTVSVTEDGRVQWQIERGTDRPSPIHAARINAETAAALISYAYHTIHVNEPKAREAWDLLAKLLPEHDVSPFGSGQ